MKDKITQKTKTSPQTYGANHVVTKTKNVLIKLEENSGNKKISEFNKEVSELANTIHKNLAKVTETQFQYILDQVARRQEHGFHYLTGNEKKLSVDKVIKLNANLTSEQIAQIDRTIATRKEVAKGGKNPIKKAAASLLGSQISELCDIPKLRYGKGSDLKMITESVCDSKALKRLASGKRLLEVAG